MFGVVFPTLNCITKFLDLCLEKKLFSQVEYVFAKSMLTHIDESNEDIAVFLCYLMRASLEGHLCISIDEEIFLPKCNLLKRESKEEEIDPDLLKQIYEKVISGSKKISKKSWIADSSYKAICPIYKYKKAFYLHKNWVFETKLLLEFSRIVKNPPTLQIDKDLYKKNAAKLFGRNCITSEQKEALLKVLEQSLLFLCGGPGTGKTYLATFLVKLLLQSLKNLHQSFHIILTAPTGKALAHLEEKILKSTHVEKNVVIEAITLHSLLQMRKNSNQPMDEHIIFADLIIVDESSMIDTGLMAYLFASISNNTHLVMMGDPNQLPPIESGNMFAQLSKVNDKKFTVTLNQAKRFKNESLKNISTAILEQNEKQFFQLLKNDPKTFSFFSEEQIFKKEFYQTVFSIFPYPSNEKFDPKVYLELFSSFRILSFFKNNQKGIHEINQMIFSSLLQNAKAGQWYIVPVLVTKNNSHIGLINGEMGVFLGKYDSFHQNSFFSNEGSLYFFDHEKKNELKSFSFSSVRGIKLGFCLSVHKSQGSEFDEVCLVATKGSEIFGKNALYTAVTRAMKKLTIFAEEKTLSEMIQNQSNRYSQILERYQEL